MTKGIYVYIMKKDCVYKGWGEKLIKVEASYKDLIGANSECACFKKVKVI